jgi:uncharacterized membrane protein YgcG
VSNCNRFFIAAVMLLTGAVAATADERILAYHADIEIGPDAGVTVTEQIRVRSEGDAIRRGIYRDFPTRYRDRLGNRYRVGFDVLTVSRDGSPEPFHTESISNGIRVYIGTANRMLPPGVHEYVIRYRTNRQLGFFDDYDELYWNVTGLGWAFPIDRASARLFLPGPVSQARLRLASYTGPEGSEGSMAVNTIEPDGAIMFQTTTPLGRYEGLTIAVGWPKGLVTAPNKEQRVRWFLQDNAGVLVLLLAAALMLAWYLWAWYHKGRDPEKGVIIPRYEPPKGLSPAACRYVRDMGFGRESFTAAVVSLGVKGHILIEEEDGDFTLTATQEGGSLRQAPSPGERAVLDALLPAGGSIEMSQDNHRAFRKAQSGIRKALAGEYKGRLFKLNGLYALPAILISVLAAVAAAFLGQRNPLIWGAWAVFAGGLHILFVILLRAPTIGGRRIMDEIDGFELYLGTAEQDRLDRMKSPQLTPQVFELFLPYAFALGVENRWVERFEREFPLAEPDQGGYRPAWYHGDLGRTGALHHLGSNLGSELSGAIASASTPPGSSSGSGGGGFSGGGGGGGGGGGW